MVENSRKTFKQFYSRYSHSSTASFLQKYAPKAIVKTTEQLGGSGYETNSDVFFSRYAYVSEISKGSDFFGSRRLMCPKMDGPGDAKKKGKRKTKTHQWLQFHFEARK